MKKLKKLKIEKVPSQSTMATKLLNEAFRHLEATMAMFEKMDPNVEFDIYLISNAYG